MTTFKHAMTLTFGDKAENNPGMEQFGNGATEGFTKEDLINVQKVIEEHNIKEVETELLDLRSLVDKLPEGSPELEEAYVLIIRQFLSKERADAVSEENMSFEWDKKLWNNKLKVVQNKNARHNVCYGKTERGPNYNEGMGTIKAWSNVPKTYEICKSLPLLLGEKGEDLVCEGNLYYDIKKTGISWHGDGERKKVFGVRCGETIPLCFRWWYQNSSFGETLKLELNHGDAYIMSEKAVGSDWKKRKFPTLRHSAGCEKYTKVTK